MKFRILFIFLVLSLNSCYLFRNNKNVPFTFHSDTELVFEKEIERPPKTIINIHHDDVVENEHNIDTYSTNIIRTTKNDLRFNRKESVSRKLFEKKVVSTVSSSNKSPNFLSLYLEIIYGMFISTIPVQMNLVSFEFGGMVFSLLALGYIAWIIYFVINKPRLDFSDILSLSLPIIIPNTILSIQILMKEILQTQFMYTSYVLGIGILVVLFLLIYILLAAFAGDKAFIKSLEALLNFIKLWNFLITISFITEFFIYLI